MERLRPATMIGHECLHARAIRAILPKVRGLAVLLLLPAVEFSRGRRAGTAGKACDACGMIDGFLGHRTVGRPLPASDRDQAGLRDDDGMFPGQAGGRCPLLASDATKADAGRRTYS